jgi:hypothetical protein
MTDGWEEQAAQHTVLMAHDPLTALASDLEYRAFGNGEAHTLA